MNDLHLQPEPFAPLCGKDDVFLLTSYDGLPGFRYHYHPQYELTLILGSAGRRLVGGDVADYARRDLALIGPCMPHTWAAERPCGLTARNHVLHFTRDSIGLDFLARSEMKDILALLNRAARGLVFSDAAALEVGVLIQGMNDLKGGQRVVRFLSILDRLASGARARYILPTARPQFDVERDYAALARILEYINRHGHSPIRLEEVASRCGMSVATFSRFFRRATGTSFIDYLNDWHISRACALLTATDHTILEISQRAGFNNLSHFNRQFLRRRGQTPREYRAHFSP